MPPRSSISIFMLAAAVLVAAGLSSSAAPAERRLGVVSLAHVFKQYRRSAELEARINVERDELRRELGRQKEAVASLERELEADERAGRPTDAKEGALDEAREAFKRMQPQVEAAIRGRWEEYNRLLLADIDRAVAAHGKEGGFALIVQSPSDTDRMKSPVLYRDESVQLEDVTAAVVERLNAEAAKPAPPGEGGR